MGDRKEGNMAALRVILLSLLLRFTQQQGSILNDGYDLDNPEMDHASYEDNPSDDYSYHHYPHSSRTKRFLYSALLKNYEKKCAQVPFTDFRCGCDPECAKYGDCCPDSIYFKAEEQKLGASTASCYNMDAFNHFYVMTRCPPAWEDPQTRYLCEHPDPPYPIPSPMFDTLVTSLRTNVTYRNSYCASCHKDLHKDMFNWSLEVSCEFDAYKFRKVDTMEYFQHMFYDEITSEWYFDLSGLEIVQCVPCAISLIDAGQSYTVNCPSPSPAVFPNGTKALCKFRPKWDQRMNLERRLRGCEYSISSCASDWNDTTERELCEAYTAHVSSCNKNYRNYHCALCNYEVYYNDCFINKTQTRPAFAVLLDRSIPPYCIRNEVYDSLSHKCAEILPHQKGSSMNDGSCLNVSLSKEEYIISEENNTVFLPSLKATYYQHEYYIEDDKVVLCLSAKPKIRFSPELGYITITGLSLSIICILLYLIALCLVPKQLNLPAMNLASLCVSLLLLYTSFIASGTVSPGTTSCVVVAIVVHYGLVASFFWMLIISFDIFNMTRRTQTKLVAVKGVQLGRFIMYSTTGWLTPTIITGSAVLLDHVIPTSSFAPAYGKHNCWFNHSNALLLFCLTPLIFVMSLNVVFFVMTSYLIRQVRNSTRTPAKHTNFKLSVRLFIVMGLTWITGISAAAFDAEVLWYLFVLLNTTQGVFIFIAFTCRKKLREELQNVFKKSTNFKTRNDSHKN